MAVSLDELSKALVSLEKALTVEKTDISRDASIQRFEFCVELSWKSARKVMVSAKNDISAHVSKIQEVLEQENFPFKVDIVESKNFAESYRDSFDSDKVQL